jgi:hypothetical protein
MAKFGINSQVDIDEICLDSSPKPDGKQRGITLQLSDWDKNNPPQIGTASNAFVRVTATNNDMAHRRSTFRIEATKDAKGTTYIWDKAATEARDKDTVLRVRIGKVTNHGGFQHDLLADLLGRSEDPRKLWVYLRILSPGNNNLTIGRNQWDRLLADQPLKQITDPDHPSRWNCGAALDHFGTSQFGAAHYAGGMTPLYKPFRPKAHTENQMSDIEFIPEKVARAAAKLRTLLENKTAVTIFVVHHNGFSVSGGIIQQTGHTHFLTVIGCDSAAKEFLVTDPWPGGSRLMYTSGILDTVDSAFMGRLKFDPDANRISTPAGSRGVHDYLVLTGPQ